MIKPYTDHVTDHIPLVKSNIIPPWARVRAGRHTLGQVAIGVLVGATLAFLVFPAAARVP